MSKLYANGTLYGREDGDKLVNGKTGPELTRDGRTYSVNVINKWSGEFVGYEVRYEIENCARCGGSHASPNGLCLDCNIWVNGG